MHYALVMNASISIACIIVPWNSFHLKNLFGNMYISALIVDFCMCQ